MVIATIGTIPFSYRQVLGLVILVAANMTKLATWIPLVYLDKLFALPSKFILQYVREHIPAIVGYGSTKTELATFLMFCHGLDANILNANGIIAVYKIASLLMQKITALISNLLMKHSHTQSLLFSVVAPLLPFG